MNKWVQMDFSMRSGDQITSGWEETNFSLEEFNPFTTYDEHGVMEQPEPVPGRFIGFPDSEDPRAMIYVQIVEVEAFKITMVEGDERPEDRPRYPASADPVA